MESSHPGEVATLVIREGEHPAAVTTGQDRVSWLHAAIRPVRWEKRAVGALRRATPQPSGPARRAEGRVPALGPCLCHEDLNPYNVLFELHNGEPVLTGVLDFEAEWAGLPESDLARLELWRWTRGAALRDGYAATSSVSDSMCGDGRSSSCCGAWSMRNMRLPNSISWIPSPYARNWAWLPFGSCHADASAHVTAVLCAWYAAQPRFFVCDIAPRYSLDSGGAQALTGDLQRHPGHG
jgi:Phosphotransferase enzyme family